MKLGIIAAWWRLKIMFAVQSEIFWRTTSWVVFRSPETWSASCQVACARELKAAYSDRDWRATDDVRRTTMFSPHIHHQQPRLSHILNRITKPFASQA